MAIAEQRAIAIRRQSHKLLANRLFSPL